MDDDDGPPGGVTQDGLHYPWGQRWTYVGTLWDERFASLGQRDSEATLDPTLFRMYTSTQGRWLSPDPLAGDITNPQSLNRYAYVLNSPASVVDPLGLAGQWGNSTCGMFFSTSCLGGPSVSCYVDGFDAPCSMVMGLAKAGAGVVCPYVDCSNIRATADSTVWQWNPPTFSIGPYQDNGDSEDQPGSPPSYTINTQLGFWGAVGTVQSFWDMCVICGFAVNQTTSNFSAGAGDFLSFGATETIRKSQGTNDLVNQQSGAYLAGGATGLGIAVAGGALGAGKIVAGLETKIAIHGADHIFRVVGAVPQLQVMWWLSGVSWSHQAIRIPLTPWWP